MGEDLVECGQSDEERRREYLKLCKRFEQKPIMAGEYPEVMHYFELREKERRESRKNRKPDVETEIKLRVDEETISRLEQVLGPAKWKLQENVIYQTAEGFVRFRKEDETTTLTIKGKNYGGRYNERVEIEEPIDKFTFESIYCRGEKAGAIIYEKLRATYEFGKCTLCLDNLQGRYFVEIEGEKKDIAKNISRLDLRNKPLERRDYSQIVREEIC